MELYLSNTSKSESRTVLEKVEHFEAAYDAGMQIINYENWQALCELTQTGLIGSDVNNRLLKAAQTTLEQVKQAEVVKAQLTEEPRCFIRKNMTHWFCRHFHKFHQSF